MQSSGDRVEIVWKSTGSFIDSYPSSNFLQMQPYERQMPEIFGLLLDGAFCFGSPMVCQRFVADFLSIELTDAQIRSA